ncbi:MAG: GNAT family N-acetyltransferase [Thermoplasmatota archaeon]
MSIELNISRIGPQQVEEARSLANRRLRETYSAELFQHFFENFNSCFLVASHDGRIAGFILGVPLEGITLRILMLAVDEGFLKMGVGSTLMASAEAYASSRKMSAISLEVGVKNEVAINFYKRLGFALTGMLPHYYEDGSDAFVMRKALPV